ncbi:MAG: acyl-CoA dehydrogenase [Rhodospirillaceae bacterium]|nr:acyl-CoA dehydrogenase [Rhodospirillaceae bacterium]|tara:strand:+ start:1636 stop:2793 length:1158 start_codon:yes stop_codon:yes gene_type:complete
MEYPLSEEHQLFRETMKRFVDEEMIPVEMETCDEDGELKPDWKEKYHARAKELGIWKMEVPEEYGGVGADLISLCIVWEQLGRTVAVPTRGLGGIMGPQVRAPLYELSDELKEQYLFPVLNGEKRACFAQSEPDAGGDPGGMRTTAELKGDHYVINGTKQWITEAGNADFAQLLAVTDKEKGSRGGISMFLVDMDSPGVTIAGQFDTMMGDKPYIIHFDNVEVPVEKRIGEEGQGFSLGQRFLANGRLKHGSRGVGTAQRCLDLMCEYAKQRETFGEPLANRQAVQWMITDTYVELQAARLMVYNVADRAAEGNVDRTDGFIQKMYADELGFRAADRCLQIHGGIGLTEDLPIENFWRQSRSFRITEGPTEIMKMVIARNILREY